MKRIANILTFLLYVAFAVIAGLGLIVDGQARTPLATEAEKVLSPLIVSGTDRR
jgi:hypothetical protein